MLGAEALKLSNQARFIIEKCDGSLTVENKKRMIMIEELVKRNYDPDPVKKWKKSQSQQIEDSQEVELQDSQENDGDADENESSEETKAEDYDYLLGMAMWSLTKERKEQLLRQKQEKHQELDKLRATSKEDIWRHDLREFVKKLDEYEQKQLEDRKEKPKKGNKKKTIVGPSYGASEGIRVVPQISDEMKKKASTAVEQKKKKESKSGNAPTDVKLEVDEPDEFDDMADDKKHNRSLSDRLGVDLKSEEKTQKSKPKSKDASAKITQFFKTKQEESGENSSSDENSQTSIEPVQKISRPRKLMVADGSEDSDFGTTAAKSKKSSNDQKPPPAKKSKVTVPKEATKNTAPKQKAKAVATKGKPKKSKNAFDSSDEESGSDFNFEKDEEDGSEVLPAREKTGRARKVIANYNFGGASSDSEDEFL